MIGKVQRIIVLIVALLVVFSTAGAQQPAGEVSDLASSGYDPGEIPVEYALSPTGATTYRVPIDIPADPEGFQPQLSFAYNSQQQKSALGYGWNIGGLSGITHVAGSIFYDGAASPLSLEGDKLMLDGTRLLKTGTDSWQSEQGFVKVKKLADGSLEGRYPDGNTVRFETSAQTPFSYVATLCTNRKGRSIRYTYAAADHLPYIRKVEYGQDTAGVYNDSVVFTYRNTADGVTRYVDGKSFKYSRLLEKVEAYYKGKLWRRYHLTYQDRGVNLPVQLECETEEGRLTPLQFKYGDGGGIAYLDGRVIYLERYFKNSLPGADEHRSLALSRGKFSRLSNGDGLISYPVLEGYNEAQHILVYKDLSRISVDPVVFTAGKGFQQMEAVDVDGSGLEKPVRVNYIDGQLTVSIYTSKVDPNEYQTYTYSEGSGYLHDRQMLTGDFNGDGKVELLAVSSCIDGDKNRYPSRALLVDLGSRRTLYDGACFDFAKYSTDDDKTRYGDRLIAMDYNGDGKTDICLININGTYIYEFVEGGFKQLAHSNGIKSTMFNFESRTIRDRELMVADMNGDGNMDLVLGPHRVHVKEGFKHFGDGFCHRACENENNLVTTSASGYKHYKDHAGQECTVDPSVPDKELVLFDWEAAGGKKWTFLISTGNSSYTVDSPGFQTRTEDLFYCYYETVGLNFVLVDVDSDGLPDLLRYVKGTIYLHPNVDGKISRDYNYRSVLRMDNLSAQFAIANVAQSYYWSGSLICVDNEKLHAYRYTDNRSKENMLHKLTDSYGVAYNHYYMDLMSTSESRYQGSPDSSLGSLSYPYTVMTPHLFVPSWLQRTKGNEQLSWEYYHYTNAVFHRTGLGFRGFRKIVTEDMVNKRTMASVFDPQLLGAEVQKSTPTDTVTRRYVLERAKNKIALLKLEKETVKDVLNRTEKTTWYRHNTYGQVVQDSTLHDMLRTTLNRYLYQNVNTSGTYLLGLPVYAHTKVICGDSLMTRATGTIYDSRYLPVRKLEFFNESIVRQEQCVYDGHWQLTERKQCNYESEDWLTEIFAYDAEGRLVEEADPMGRITRYVYHPETGQLQSSTDHQGRATRYRYNGWGRAEETVYPDGHSKHLSTAWSKADEPGLYVETVVETGKPVTKTYYDPQKREVRAAQIRFDGRELKTDKEYDSRTGLLKRESMPTTDSLPSRWNTYRYDQYDRRTSVRHASGKLDSCAYGALTDTIIENGIRRIRCYDVTGKMLSSTDASGTLSYYYRPDGQPVAVVISDSVHTRFYYDKYGRRTAIKDPSAGIRRTEYDAAGNVSKETDADGRETVKEYDRYGRVTKQTADGLSTTYVYDDAENRLLSATSDNGTAHRYAYDALGRLETEREETPDGTWLERRYTYAADGLLASIAHSSADGELATERFTYRNGFLTETRLQDGTLVYRHDAENEQGQLTRLASGEMQRDYEFDEWGLPVRRTIRRADGIPLFDDGYRFNPETNNLESRTDHVRNLTESFEYDALNRLTGYGGERVTYGDNGNILAKSDAGSLAYTNPNRPYAVTGLTPEDGQADSAKPGLKVAYTAGERPSLLTLGTAQAALDYNADRDRIRMVLSDGGRTLLTRHYLGGNYERDADSTGVQERIYLGGGYYDAPAVLVKRDGSRAVYFIHRDYLGSIRQVADAQGNIVEENSFDAWGQRRNPATHEVYAAGEAPRLLLGRGYTGHEHLPLFGLINMNARLYDPLLGRFLSPDPYVQLPDFTQAFNRYSYCMNSPLCYVDEDGEFWWILIAAAVGGAFNVVTNWDNIDNFGQGLAYFGVGAAAGTVAAVTGGAVAGAGFIGGALGGMAGGAASGFFIGAGNTLLQGGNFGESMLGGLYGSAAGAVVGGISGGITGGVLSYIKGENVWSGQQIAQGRNAFSLKNTPVNVAEHPEMMRFSFDDALSAFPEDPLLNNINNTSMSPYEKGQMGVNEAMREFKAEGGKVFSTEVSIDVPNGAGGMVRNRFDFVGELDGQLHLFEVKNGPRADFRINQKINLPKLMKSHPQFIPVGAKALEVPAFKDIIGKPYIGNYVVVIKHYF